MSRDFPTPAVVELLRSDDRFETVPRDPAYAQGVMDELLAAECELALFAAARGQWAKTNTLTYDAARKSLEALLIAHGWRIRAVAGAHAAAVELAAAWLSRRTAPAPRIAAKFSAARKARHEDEYPDPRSRRRADDELRALAQDNVRLMNLIRVELGSEPAPHLVPTAENVSRFT